MYSNGGIQSFHGIDMDWFMESIWNGDGMRKWLGPQPKVIPYGFHGFHMDYTGEDKDLVHWVTIIQC